MIPFKKRQPAPQPAGQTIILDTCALIDGRIIAIAKSGFLPRRLMIPQFVIAELQYLADTGDSQKRERARFGLDVIRELQELKHSAVVISREQFPEIKQVDDKLIALAKLHRAQLYTTDYNLNKVAQIEGVRVLNVNELAHALRPPRLPGERVDLKITQIGQDKTQGVGYLEDGTMVVVEQAGKLVGQRIRVEFSRILQTQAGKMMFAVLVGQQQGERREQPKKTDGAQKHTGSSRPNQPQKSHKKRPQNNVEDSLMSAIRKQQDQQ